MPSILPFYIVYERNPAHRLPVRNPAECARHRPFFSIHRNPILFFYRKTILEFLRISQYVLEYSEIAQDFLQISRISQDFLEFLRIF